MEDDWHYAVTGDGARGPISKHELGRILADLGTGTSSLLVWRPGMSNWAPPGDVPALREFLQPRVDGEPWPASVTHPWRRYFARILDTTFFVVVFFLFIGILFPSLFDSPPAKGAERAMEWLYQIAGFVAYAPFEAFCMHIFGNTVGKALYGIRVSAPTGGNMGLAVASKRSFHVLVRGIGLGIPVVCLITLLTSYNTLRHDGVTSWDRQLGCVVTHHPLSHLRIFMLTAAWIVLILILVALRSIA
jgi:uncharacterized RDD family membrane protein YckC